MYVGPVPPLQELRYENILPKLVEVMLGALEVWYDRDYM